MTEREVLELLEELLDGADCAINDDEGGSWTDWAVDAEKVRDRIAERLASLKEAQNA